MATLEDVEADQGRYLAMTVSSVAELRLTEARLSADQWEEVGKEIRQPHSKLRQGRGHDLCRAINIVTISGEYCATSFYIDVKIVQH